MQIIIPEDYQNAVSQLDCYAKLADHDVTTFNDHVTNTEALVARFQDAEALVLIRERTAITTELLAQLPNLKIISQTGRGIAHIDLAACTKHGVVVMNGGGSPYATAELTWGLVLAAMRHIPQEVAQLKQGHWQTSLGLGLHGRTLGIFGYGQIGSLVANYGRVFGMDVVIWGRAGSLSRAQTDGYRVANSQRDLFIQADVLCLHIKLNSATQGIVTAEDLMAMNSTALIVNTSRAGLIETGALEQALRKGRPGRAAIDVYEHEPASHDPLLTLDNIICTPHLGYVEKDGYELYFGTAFDNILTFLNGQPQNILNPEARQHTKHQADSMT